MREFLHLLPAQALEASSDGKAGYINMLWLLLRLRQACNHPGSASLLYCCCATLVWISNLRMHAVMRCAFSVLCPMFTLALLYLPYVASTLQPVYVTCGLPTTYPCAGWCAGNGSKLQRCRALLPQRQKWQLRGNWRPRCGRSCWGRCATARAPARCAATCPRSPSWAAAGTLSARSAPRCRCAHLPSPVEHISVAEGILLDLSWINSTTIASCKRNLGNG